MSIVKQTFKDTLRRRWKLALGVLLVGVLLTFVTNTTDVSGVLEDVEAAAEAVTEAAEEDAEEIPAEELGQMMRGAGQVFVLGALIMFFSLGVVILGSFVPQGLVAQEADGGNALEAQQSVSSRGLFWQRYGGTQLASLFFMLILGLTAAARMPDGGFVLATSLGALARVCLLGTVACTISLGFAAFGNRRAAWLGLAYYLGSWLAGGLASLLDSLSDTNVLGAVLQFVIFPTGPIGQFSQGVGAAPWDWGATGLVAYHFALWTGIALLGLRRMAMRPVRES